jgi:hypothetical protein
VSLFKDPGIPSGQSLMTLFCALIFVGKKHRKQNAIKGMLPFMELKL